MANPPFDLSTFDLSLFDLSYLHPAEQDRIRARQFNAQELSILLAGKNPWTESGKPAPLPTLSQVRSKARDPSLDDLRQIAHADTLPLLERGDLNVKTALEQEWKRRQKAEASIHNNDDADQIEAIQHTLNLSKSDAGQFLYEVRRRRSEVSVLIIDDDPTYLEAVAKNLELVGADVTTVTNPEDGLAALQSRRFDVVIADVLFSNSDETGDQFIVGHRPLMKGAEVILVTGHGTGRIKHREYFENSGVQINEKGAAGHIELLRKTVANRGELKSLGKSIDRSTPAKAGSAAEVTTRGLRVFLCHSSGDKSSVRSLYQRLKDSGFEPWLDEESILPGHDWEREIQKAVRESDVVIVCLSKGSVNKKGFVQKEIKLALDIADEQPEGTIFIIPAKIEECEVPQRLRRWQWVSLFEQQGYRRLTLALDEAFRKLSR